MMPKSGIQEFLSLYHRYIWLINIPFVVYFAISLCGIAKMKSEVNIMKDILMEEANERFKNNQKNYKLCSFVANKSETRKIFHKSIESPLQNVQGMNNLNSEDWLTALDELESHFRILLEMDEPIFKFKKYELQWGSKYPAIQTFITSKYSNDIMNILYSKIYPGHCSLYLCSWFYPIVQEYGDASLLYPNVFNVCDPSYSEFWVNGDKVDGHTYYFKPKYKGLHTLDIEYKYLHTGFRHEIVKVTKELLVQ